jgi:hypothetical protein
MKSVNNRNRPQVAVLGLGIVRLITTRVSEVGGRRHASVAVGSRVCVATLKDQNPVMKLRIILYLFCY